MLAPAFDVGEAPARSRPEPATPIGDPFDSLGGPVTFPVAVPRQIEGSSIDLCSRRSAHLSGSGLCRAPASRWEGDWTMSETREPQRTDARGRPAFALRCACGSDIDVSDQDFQFGVFALVADADYCLVTVRCRPCGTSATGPARPRC